MYGWKETKPATLLGTSKLFSLHAKNYVKPSKKNQQNDRFALNASIEADQKPFDIIIFSDSYNKEESWL